MNLSEANEMPSDDLSPFPGLGKPAVPENPLSVWPNPAGSVVNVKLAEPQTATILLLDATGTPLVRKRIYYKAEAQLDVQNIPPGRYTVVAEYHGQTFSEKLLVSR